jgi:hypothetical protein
VETGESSWTESISYNLAHNGSIFPHVRYLPKIPRLVLPWSGAIQLFQAPDARLSLPNLMLGQWLHAITAKHFTPAGRYLALISVGILAIGLMTLPMPIYLLSFSLASLFVVDFVAGWTLRPRLAITRASQSPAQRQSPRRVMRLFASTIRSQCQHTASLERLCRCDSATDVCCGRRISIWPVALGFERPAKPTDPGVSGLHRHRRGPAQRGQEFPAQQQQRGQQRWTVNEVPGVSRVPARR